MAKSGASEAVKWIAIGVGALIFVPRILASTTRQNAQTAAAYNPNAALAAQQARLVNQGGGLLSGLLAALTGQKQSNNQPKPNTPFGSSAVKQAQSAQSSSSLSNLFGFDKLSDYFGDKQEAKDLAMDFAAGDNIETASDKVGENWQEVASALTGVDVTGNVDTVDYNSPYQSELISDDTSQQMSDQAWADAYAPSFDPGFDDMEAYG